MFSEEMGQTCQNRKALGSWSYSVRKRLLILGVSKPDDSKLVEIMKLEK